jgi:hypothetical protein
MSTFVAENAKKARQKNKKLDTKKLKKLDTKAPEKKTTFVCVSIRFPEQGDPISF